MILGKVGVVVAARTRSRRLPGKALMPLMGKPMVLFLLERLSPLTRGTLLFATSDHASDDVLAETVRRSGVTVFRGSENDLVSRFAAAAAMHGFDTLARITADCPFLDGELVDFCLAQAKTFPDFDIATTKGQFPVGLDVEIFPAHRLREMQADTGLTEAHREHLTLFMYDHPERFRIARLQPRPEWVTAGQHFTVDTQDDYDLAIRRLAPFVDNRFSVGQLVERAAA